MATGSKMGGRRKVYFTCSTGQTGGGSGDPAKEYKVPSGWKPGKSKNKYKP